MTDNSERFWTAFYTKPRNEKKALERLSDQGYEVFCPLRTVLKQWSDRKKKVKEVLFTSYIFCRVTEQERVKILQDPSIVSSVFWLKKPVVIPSKEIEGIKNFIAEYPEAEAANERFEMGQMVKIAEGPLKGEVGEVLKDGSRKAVLLIDSLGVSLQAEVSKRSIELIK